MNEISAKVIEDSIGFNSPRLVTIQIKCHRFIWAEFMTHRVFSRNTSSSRAIPVKRMLEDIQENPAVPIFWGKNQPGMQAENELKDYEKIIAEKHWHQAKEAAIEYAKKLNELGVHKQITNRLVEPFMYIRSIVTSTQWSNFFALRDHPDAQPEIRQLAVVMKEAMQNSEPTFLNPGEWHLPYVTESERVSAEDLYDLKRISAARCARVSFLRHDGTAPSFEDDIKLFNRLSASEPIHASPLEHQATPDAFNDRWLNEELHGNLTGYIQFRKTIRGECQ